MKKLLVVSTLCVIAGLFSIQDFTLSAKDYSSAPEIGIDGEKIYKNYCTLCHGLNGKLNINGATDLSISTMNMKERVQIITDGKELMAPFKNILSEKEIKAVAKYTMELTK